MIRFAVPILILATAATGAASEQRNSPKDQARLDRTIAGLTPRAPVNCVQSRRISEVKGYDGEILYIEGRNRVYRNKTQGSCDGLKRGDILVTKTWGAEYCSGDIVTTREQTSGTFTGSCALGKFVPYTK